MWLVIFGIMGIAVLIGGIYMIVAVSKFPGIIKLSKQRKVVSLLVSFLILALLFAAFTYFTSITNAAVILLHFILFMAVFSLVAFIYRKATHTKTIHYLHGWLAILACTVYLIVAYILCQNVWLKEYDLSSDKLDGELKIAFFADSHMGTTFDGEGFIKELKKIEAQNPDILLIPGDFIDDETTHADMIKACAALGDFKSRYGVFFSFGNHDRGYYRDENSDFDEHDLINELQKNGVHVLIDQYELIDDRFYVVGREDASYDRKSASEVVEGLEDKYIIVLDHEPNDYDAEAATSMDLVLSGHTHGGQLFPITYLGELFGVNDNTYGYERRNDTDFIVTSGISDWAILFKTGTKSEYVIINVNGK